MNNKYKIVYAMQGIAWSVFIGSSILNQDKGIIYFIPYPFWVISAILAFVDEKKFERKPVNISSKEESSK